MRFENFWQKIAALVSVPIRLADGSKFRFHDDAPRCFGVSYQAAWGWITHGSVPKGATIVKVVEAMNCAFQTKEVITEKHLSDETTLAEFAVALGVPPEDAENAELSRLVMNQRRDPLDSFSFRDIDEAKRNAHTLSGLYSVVRFRANSVNSRPEAQLALSVRNVFTERPDRNLIFARLSVPSATSGNYHYDGVVCVRNGLLYWVFSQYGVMLSDFLFMVSERLDGNGVPSSAQGTLITMGQSKPEPITRLITIKQASKSFTAEMAEKFLQEHPKMLSRLRD